MDEQELDELRDRGDRLRRRRTTLTVLGAAASVAVVAGAMSLAGSPGGRVLPEPAPATTSPTPSADPSSPAPSATDPATDPATVSPRRWAWSFAPDFPLDVDQVAMEGDGGEKRGPSPDEAGLALLTLCGAPIFPDDPAERLASTATGPEYADMREVRVYPTSDEASEQVTMLRDRLSTGCSQRVGSGGRLVQTPLQVDTGYDSVTWAGYYTRGLGGGPVQVTRIGRAVVAIALAGEFSEASVEGAGETVTEVTSKITPSMCVFTEDGCGA